MLKALDDNFQVVADLTAATSLIMWDRKYYDFGQFSIVIPTAEYSADMKYLYSSEHVETGIINAINYSDDLITLSGFFLEKLLDNEVLYPVFNYEGNIEQCARQMVTTYASEIPKLILGDVLGVGEDIALQETGEYLGTRIYTMYQTQELSYRLNYDYIDDIIRFETYRGIERQSSFSKRIGNILTSQLLSDDSNYKNYAIVVSESTVIVDKSEGLQKRKVYIDASDLSREDGQSLTSFKNQLIRRGEEELLSYAKVEEFTFTLTETEATRYGIDFDLGDKITIDLPEIGLELTARITEINEVIKENRREISVTMGEQKPTLYQKAILRR